MTTSGGTSRRSRIRTSSTANTDVAIASRVVAVTGATGPIGTAIIERLVTLPEVSKVIAIDSTRGDAGAIRPSDTNAGPGASDPPTDHRANVVWRVTDISSPDLVRRLGRVDVVVHAAVDFNVETDPIARTQINVGATRTVVTASAAAGVRRLVLITSAMVYGASVDNPLAIDEDAPLDAVPEGLLADLIEIERIAVTSRAVHRGLEITVVRPAALVGPGIDTMVTRHFAAPRLLKVRDAHPRWQFCHVDDLVSAVALLVSVPTSVDVPTDGSTELPNAVNVGCDGWLEQDEVESLTGMHPIELPTGLVFAAASRLHRAGLTPAPASELTYLLHPWVVSATWLRSVGWVPAYDNAAALSELIEGLHGEHALAGHRFGRRDATVAGASAAGATVALIGAAALVRRARRARGF